MEYSKALKVHEIVEEIKLNDADMETIDNAMNGGIESAQINIKTRNGNYYSHCFKNDRIDLLLGVLSARNIELMKNLEEI